MYMVNLLIWIIFMRNKNINICLVCGYDSLDEPPYDEFGCSSFEICPCCGTEFGYDDSSVKHAELRGKWINTGKKWWSNNVSKPEDWDAEKQLNNLLGTRK